MAQKTDAPTITIIRPVPGGSYHWRLGDSVNAKNYMARDQAERAALKAHPDATIVHEPDPKPPKTVASIKPKKKRKATSADRAQGAKRVSLLDAAATILADAKSPMQAKQIVDAVVERGLWKPGAGKTPHATLYAAMTREIADKGKDARFRKVDRGLFAAGKGS